MGTSSKNTVSIHTAFTSLQDMAYSQARTGDLLYGMASYAKANIAGFPEEVTDEAKAELFAGYRQRHAEILGVTKYAIVDNNYIPADKAEGAKETVDIGVAYAFSYSQQQFGQLSSKNPQLYAIVKQIREKTNT